MMFIIPVVTGKKSETSKIVLRKNVFIIIYKIVGQIHEIKTSIEKK